MDIFPTATRHGLENLVANNLYLAMLGLFVLERFQFLSGHHSLFSPETGVRSSQDLDHDGAMVLSTRYRK